MIQNYPFSLVIHYDSLMWAYDYPSNFSDPSFHKAFDRFTERANEYGIRFSVFVIGRDLENPEVAARVRDWSSAGHEIANHSWGHRLDFSALSRAGTEYEILKSHELIEQVTGKAPRGFVAPSWSSSRHALQVLRENDYLYDGSFFPGVFYYLIMAKMVSKRLTKPGDLFQVLRRRDWLHPLTRPLDPFFIGPNGGISEGQEGDLVVLPMPTLGRFSPTVWHTLGFFFGWRYTKNALSDLLQQKMWLYYTMHAADLIGSEDLDGQFKQNMERMDVPLEQKLSIYEDIVSLCVQSGRKSVTLASMAEAVFEKAGIPFKVG